MYGEHLFGWCPNLTPVNRDACYPGNAYVDVIGVRKTYFGGPGG